jgi:predicted Zn-dependent peptidase
LLASSYLAGRTSSRFGTRLRSERSLTYSVSGETEYGSDVGYVMFRFSAPPERTTEALALCDEELGKLTRGVVAQEDLVAAKEDRVLTLLDLALDPASLASWYAKQALAELPLLSPEQVSEVIRKITTEDLTRVAKWYFTEANRSVSVVS